MINEKMLIFFAVEQNCVCAFLRPPHSAEFAWTIFSAIKLSLVQDGSLIPDLGLDMKTFQILVSGCQTC